MKLLIRLLLLLLLAPLAQAEALRKAPEFALPSMHSGQIVALEDYRGQVVLVDFWASWCEPCAASLPRYNHLRNRLREKLGGTGFEILAINVDLKEEDARAFLEKVPLDFPVLREATGKTQREFVIVGMPTAFLIDKQGYIRELHEGFSEPYLKAMAGEIIKLLDE